MVYFFVLNNLLKKFILLIPTLFSIALVSILWEEIKFTFDNPSEVIGYYSLLEHSYLNDNVRFFLYISTSLSIEERHICGNTNKQNKVTKDTLLIL